MSLQGDLRGLERRIAKVSIEKCPPTLRMIQIKESDDIPDLTCWDLLVRVEQKKVCGP